MLNIFNKLNPLAIIIILSILIIFFAAVVLTVVIRKKYMNMEEDLSNEEKRQQGAYEHEVFNYIIEDYRRAAKASPNEVNTQAIIERNFNSELQGLNIGERFIKNAVSLMIILGLLGTFYGLTLSIGKLVELLSSSGNADVVNNMDSIVGGLINSVKGMSVAFITSLFGIASSVILTIIHIFFDVEEARESVMVQIEEYLDNSVAMAFAKKKETEYLMLNQALTTTFKEFGDKLEHSLKYATKGFSTQFIAATGDMGNASEALLKSVALFDKSLQDFSENTRDFSEFNHHLRTNIDRMNVSFADFTDDLNDYSKDIRKLNGSLEKVAVQLEQQER